MNSDHPEYWAWRDNKDGSYRHIYQRKIIVQMCSPDGFKEAEERGKGKLVRVRIVEVMEDELPGMQRQNVP